MDETTQQKTAPTAQEDLAYKFDRAVRELFKLADMILGKSFPLEYAMQKLENGASFCLEKYKQIYNGSDLLKTSPKYRARFALLFNSNRARILEVLSKKPRECWLFQDTSDVNIAEGERYKDFCLRLSMIYRHALDLSDKAFAAKQTSSPDIILHERFLMVIYEVFEMCELPSHDVTEIKGIIDYLAANLKIRPINAPVVSNHPFASMFTGEGGGMNNVIMPILSAFGMDKVINDMGGLQGIQEKITSPEAQATIGGMMSKLQNAGSIQNGINMFMEDMQNNKGVADVVGSVLGPLRGMAANAAGEALKDTSNIPEPLIGMAKMLQGFGAQTPTQVDGPQVGTIVDVSDLSNGPSNGLSNGQSIVPTIGDSSSVVPTDSQAIHAAQSTQMPSWASPEGLSGLLSGLMPQGDGGVSGQLPAQLPSMETLQTGMQSLFSAFSQGQPQPGAAPSPIPFSGLPTVPTALSGQPSQQGGLGAFDPSSLLSAAQKAVGDPNSPFSGFAPMLGNLTSMFGQMGTNSSTTSTSTSSTSTSSTSTTSSEGSGADFPF